MTHILKKLLPVVMASLGCIQLSSLNAAVVLDESFSGADVPTGWTLTAQTRLLYNASFGGSYKISDTNPVSGYSTALVDTTNNERRTLALSYSLAPLNDFEANISFTWSNAVGTTQSGSTNSNAATPVMYFTFLDAGNNIVARAGIYDNWTASLGARTAEIGGSSTSSGVGTLPASSSGLNTISFLRSGSRIDINWENQLGTSVFSYNGTSAAEITSFQIATSMFRVDNINGLNTAKFGEIAVDQVTIAAIPEPSTLTSILLGAVLLLTISRKTCLRMPC